VDGAAIFSIMIDELFIKKQYRTMKKRAKTIRLNASLHPPELELEPWALGQSGSYLEVNVKDLRQSTQQDVDADLDVEITYVFILESDWSFALFPYIVDMKSVSKSGNATDTKESYRHELQNWFLQWLGNPRKPTYTVIEAIVHAFVLFSL